MFRDHQYSLHKSLHQRFLLRESTYS
jgi:hypothetical protein